MQDGMVRIVCANLEWKTVEGPESHGSTSMVKLPGFAGALVKACDCDCGDCEEEGGFNDASSGEKEIKNVESPLMCLTDNDMMTDFG